MTTSPVAFRNGRVLTMAGGPEPAVVVVSGDRVVDVGPAEVLERHPTAQVVDLDGRALLPGFIDAHNHLSLAALTPRWADLSDARDLEEVGARLREQARREPAAAWIRGTGWERQGGLRLTRDDLDELGLDRPVVVEHFSIHLCVVDSRGLDAVGVGPSTPDPPGGEIERDRAGRPTGVLRETAWSEVQAASLEPYLDPDRWDDLIVERARALLADGITAVHDAACPPAAEAAYARLRRSGRLPVSVLAMPHPAALLSLPDAGRLDGAPTGEGDEWCRVGPVKLFADGGAFPAIEGTSGGQPVRVGYTFPDVADAAVAATRRGFRVAVHAMGNAGLDRALEAFRAAARRGDADHRPRVEHATLASESQIRDMADVGAVAVVQPGFVDTLGAHVHGLELDGATWMPFADLVAAGIPIAGSSDDPCGLRPPLLTSRAGVDRLTAGGARVAPHQSVPYVEWLRAWTAGSAFAGGQEDERGTISPGKRADLVILDGDVDGDAPPRVAETWVAGRRVHPPPGSA